MPASISDASGVKVSYSYLSDGTKLSALKPNGEGLVYRGPFVYRRGSGGALTFESVSADEGRLSSAGEMLYVEDYLGSVRAVVSGAGGTLLEASDYSAFGARATAPSAPIGTTPAGITLRNHYTAQEDQAPDFAVPYTDFGARQYNTALRRWMTPDPLSEKYYGISPYAFCNNSPMVFVDREGMRMWPVNTIFGDQARRHENNFKSKSRPNHKGIDINFGSDAYDLGAPVYATHSGFVTRYASIIDDSDAGGNRIKITSVDGKIETFYMHLNTMSDLKVGDFVSEGELIGTIGGSGDGMMDRYKPHLHYELIIDGKHINPVISSTKLIDPQRLLTPIYHSYHNLEPVIIEEERNPIHINLPNSIEYNYNDQLL